MSAQQVISGKHGQVWFEDEKISGLKAAQTKDDFKMEPVTECGKMTTGYKIVGVESKGSVKFLKKDSKLVKKIANKVIREGKTPTFKMIIALDDPDALGAERMAFYNCIFTDLTRFDFEDGKLVEIEAPFVYEYCEPLDLI